MSQSGRVLLYLAVVLIGLSFWFAFKKSPYDRALQTRELATYGLGKSLATQFPGAKALVISNPFAQDSGRRRQIQAAEEAGIEGLRAGFNQAIDIIDIAYPPIKQEAVDNPRAVRIPDTTTPLSYLIAPNAFDQLAQAHPNANLIVSLIGLPADLDQVDLWRNPSPPHLALLLPDFQMLPGPDALRAAVQSGKIAAFVLNKPGAPPEQTPVSDDLDAEFHRRFLVVTADNLEDILNQHPALFPWK